jgi:hypothetical protein
MRLPLRRFGGILLWYSPAAGKTGCKLVLRFNIALFGRLSPPLQRLGCDFLPRWRFVVIYAG